MASVAAAMSKSLPIAVGAATLIVFGASTLYVWSQPEFLAAHEIVEAKRAWLNLPFFLVRAAIVFAIWLVTVPLVLRSVQTAQAAGMAILLVNATGLGVTPGPFPYGVAVTLHLASGVAGLLVSFWLQARAALGPEESA